jgi:antitoxin ParD1/3/4
VTRQRNREVIAVNVSVGKEFEEYVKGKVDSGDYASVSEVVRDGLRLMKEKDMLLEARLQALKDEIQIGIDQAERGEVVDGPTAMAEIRQHLLERFGGDAKLRSGPGGEEGP